MITWKQHSITTNMRSSVRLQLLTCLFLYASCAHGIMVKYGTSDGPIVPPTPEPQLPVPQPYQAPAPVWESRSNDSPDPNAQWRPQLFKPQPRYTQMVFNLPPQSPVLNNAQRFVNQYIPTNPQPIQAEASTNYFTPSQILSSQSLPGFGLRYFVPEYINNVQKRKQEQQQNRENRQEDAKHNVVETNDVNGVSRDSGSDLQWKYEKEATRRQIRHTQEAFATVPLYVWPAYVSPAHQ